ncbi:MAG: TRAP transporter small permease [Deltaproteobacteria bacterium]|nr:TRAP transporter small permease [Deltaproteobacteria bacterium]
MNVLKWLDKILAKIEGWLIVIFLWVMIILTFVQVCLRGLYTHAHLQWANVLMGHLDWSESLVRLMVLWLTFLGASLLAAENKHIKIDLFSTLLPPKWLPMREFVLSLVCILISAIMLKVCMDYVKIEMEFGGALFLDLPTWIGQLILPAGFAFILFRFFVRAIDQWRKIGRGLSK